MRSVICVLVLMFLATLAVAAEPLDASDFNALNKRLTDLEKRVTALEAKAFHSLPQKTQAATVDTVLRSPVGHTHTCVNGHTWDHNMTAGHDCPVCGMAQYVQDQFPRPLTGSNLSQGNCVNGQCQSGQFTSPQGSGWYPGKNLGRKR